MASRCTEHTLRFYGPESGLGDRLRVCEIGESAEAHAGSGGVHDRLCKQSLARMRRSGRLQRCCMISTGRFIPSSRPSYEGRADSRRARGQRGNSKAILSHANYSGVPRVSRLEKTLFACDELAGFLTACSYVKPGRSIFEVETASVRKKLKDKAFARSVNRDDIVNGAAELGVDLDQHITFCIGAMKARASALGLAGTADAGAQMQQ